MPSVANSSPSLSSSSIFGRFTSNRRPTNPSLPGQQERGYATDLNLPLSSPTVIEDERGGVESVAGEGRVSSGHSNATSTGSYRNRLRKQSVGSIHQNPHHRRESSSIFSFSASVTDLGESVKRSVSLRSHRTGPSSASVASTASPPGTVGPRSKSPSSGAVFSNLAGSPVESPEEVQAPILPPGPPPPVPNPASSSSPKPTLKKTLSQRFRNTSTDALKSTLSIPSQPALPPPSRDGGVANGNRSPQQASDRTRSPPVTMQLAPPMSGTMKRNPDPQRPIIGPTSSSFSSSSRDIHSSYGASSGASIMTGAPLRDTVTAASVAGNQNPTAVFQQIHEISAKRMATIEYLRRVHEGHLFYFSTLNYPPASLSAMPSLHPNKLGRRATNYFVLGYSLPGVLEQHGSGTPIEFLKALSALLAEFETFQTLAGFDASGTTISRGRVSQMLKSGMSLGGRSAKSRRSSSGTTSNNTPIPTAASIFEGSTGSSSFNHPLLSSGASTTSSSTTPLSATTPHPFPPSTDALDAYSAATASTTSAMHGGGPSAGGNPSSSSSSSHHHHAEHEFAHLVTPHLAFEPDFGTTLAALCDTLIDCYARLMELVAGPEACAPGLGEAFAKADKAIRKLLVANVVREFEDTTRAVVKGEVAGLGKVVLGGLM